MEVEDTRPLVAGSGRAPWAPFSDPGFRLLFLLLILLIRLDGYHLILAICWKLMLGYEKLWENHREDWNG